MLPLPPAAQERPVCTSTVPIRPCVIKCMCSLETRPSLYSLNFAYTSLYISPIPPPFPVVCQMKWLLLSPTPSVVFSYSHLHVHALAVRPASRWDWSTTQRHVLLHVSRRQEPDAMGTYTRTHMCITRYTCNVNSPSSWTRTHTDTSGHVNLMCASVWKDIVEKM